MVGQVLGDRYRILRPIGGGGMGTVFLCEHVVLGKRMAVKVLRPELCRDAELVRRFQQEAVAASRIGQENIVDVTDFGHTPDGSFYYVMEALDGESLGAVVAREGPLPLERALPILGQICRAVAAAHARGVIHRDLKPDNVILVRREDGDLAKVLDFGISKMGIAPGAERITQDGMIVGTPEYMAPEQASASTVDQRADIYSFGVLAYEVVTGSLPFQAHTPLATLLEHHSKLPLRPSERRPGIPTELDALILRALQKRPQDRQQTMAEVGSDLSSVLARLGLGPVFTPAVGTPAVAPSGTPILVAPSRPSGRRDTLMLGSEAVEAPAPLRPAGAPPARPDAPARPGAPARSQPAPPRRAARAVLAAAGLAAAIAAGALLRDVWSGRGATTTTTPTATATPTPTPSVQPLPTPPLDRVRTNRQRLGRGHSSEENPYRKVDDLKPDPF